MKNLTGTKGGSGVWQRIISEMPEHDVFIEAFWGRGTITRKKRPAEITIGVDLDPDAISSGEVLAHMWQCDSIQFLRNYFRLPATPQDMAAVDRLSSPAATFGGFPSSRHLVYLDPPYWGCEHYYKFQAAHDDVIDVFLNLPCPTMLSGIWSEYYAERLAGTRATHFQTVNRAGKAYDEWLWMNFDPPSRYHDTRFIGDGRRERERIRRRVKTWREGLLRMSQAERQAVLDGCSAALVSDAGLQAEEMLS